MTEILIAVVSGIFTFAGVIVTVAYGNKKNEKCVKDSSELMLYRIEQLEKKQDKHNTLIERMYKVEERLDTIEVRLSAQDEKINFLHTEQ